MDTRPNFLDNNIPPPPPLPRQSFNEGGPHKSISHWAVVAVTIVSVIGYFMASYYYEFWPFSAVNVPTADWQTGSTELTASYRNEEYGFEFKYPSNWTIADYSTDDLVYFYSNQHSTMDLLVGLKGSDEYFNEVVINASDCGGDSNDTRGCTLIPRKNSKLKINGLIVYKSVGVNDTKYFLQNPNKQNIIELYNVNETKANQILSTFRFIDQN